MSSKKPSRTPSGGKKGKRKEEVKKSSLDAHSKKTIKSFFRPISDRSLCRTSSASSSGKISSEDDCVEIVHPSPLKKVKVGLDNVFISPINKSGSNESCKDVNHEEIKSPQLELKNKNIQKVCEEAPASIVISSDSDVDTVKSEDGEVQQTEKDDTLLEDENCVTTTTSPTANKSTDTILECENEVIDTSQMKGETVLEAKNNIIEDIGTDQKDPELSIRKKLKLKRKSCMKSLGDSLNVLKNIDNKVVNSFENETEELYSMYSVKRKSSHSENNTKNKKVLVEVVHKGDEMMNIDDEINIDDSFDTFDFDSEIPIPPTVKVSSMKTEIDLSDSFLDVDLDDFIPVVEDVSVLHVWKVKNVTITNINIDDRIINEKVLSLQLTINKDNCIEATCHLRGDWYFMEIDIDDKVYASGLSKSKTSCIIDNNYNDYLISYPNTLISGTTIAAGITCERKAVLNERFKMDLNSNKAVFLGSLTHELFDWILHHKNCSVGDIEKRAKENLNNSKYLEQLSLLGLDIPDIIDMQKEYYTSLVTWCKQFMIAKEGSEIDFKLNEDQGKKVPTNVHIDNIVDIEENVWAPYYGLKGRVDATVEVTIHRKPNLNSAKTKKKYLLPLEFKTGKLLSDLGSVEHRAQVAVYTILLSEKYNLPIETGLLLYGKTNHMIGIPRPVQEKRSILIKRNEIARNLTLERNHLSLPPMIQKQRICRRCDQRGACMLYSKSLENGCASSSGVDEIFTESTNHLSSDDLDYFAKWYELSIIEASYDNKGSRNKKYIWTRSAEQREKDGVCFSGMVNISNNVEMNLMCEFKRKQNHFDISRSLKSVPLTVGDRVIISEENSKVFNITTGYIKDISSDILTISLSNKVNSLSQKDGKLYRIDRDDTLSNYTTPLSNLSKLFTVNSDPDTKLRNLIIKGEKPNFSGIEVSGDCSSNSNDNLNACQKLSIDKCLSANDYVVIHGMPGAGKSTTIASLVQALVSNGKSVLLSSYTHSAVDTILVKLLNADFCNFVRIGQTSRVHAKVQPYVYQEKTKDFTDVHNFKTFYDELKVVATTCLGVNHTMFLTKRFDYCIVDEASQITQPVCIGPIRFANVFILVGDHNQLPPLVICPEAKEKGLDRSLFQSLSERRPDAVVTLNYQYRMNSSIMSLMNSLVYENRMQCGNEEVANALLRLDKYDVISKTILPQLCEIVKPENPVVFVNTDEALLIEEKSGSFIVNRGEALLVKQIVNLLVQCGLFAHNIGVISMYRHQVNIIREELTNVSGIEVDTMDKYQGKDKDCIIVSFVRSNSNGEVGDLLKDWRRVNVAMTRAKTKLILIGSRSTIVHSEILCKLVELIDQNVWCLNLEKQLTF